MSALADRIRRARESQVEAGGHDFTIRRPTDAEAASLGAVSNVQYIARFTVGWNLKEIDLVPGGNPVDAPFDSDAFCEWVSDQPDVAKKIAEAITEAYKAHAEKRDTDAKNS